MGLEGENGGKVWRGDEEGGRRGKGGGGRAWGGRHGVVVGEGVLLHLGGGEREVRVRVSGVDKGVTPLFITGSLIHGGGPEATRRISHTHTHTHTHTQLLHHSSLLPPRSLTFSPLSPLPLCLSLSLSLSHSHFVFQFLRFFFSLSPFPSFFSSLSSMFSFFILVLSFPHFVCAHFPNINHPSPSLLSFLLLPYSPIVS